MEAGRRRRGVLERACASASIALLAATASHALDVTSLSTQLRSCVLTESSGARGAQCWGLVGEEPPVFESVPTPFVGVPQDAIAILRDACVVTAAGAVSCPDASGVYAAITGLESGIAQADLGAGHSCALDTSGGVLCWGDNQYGQLGDGTTTPRANPVAVVGLGGTAVDIGLGLHHSCAVLDTGGMRCWGLNGEGQLGNGTTSGSSPNASPVVVSGLGGTALEVRGSTEASCARLSDGSVECFGKLGTRTYGTSPTPVPGSAGAAQLSMGSNHGCYVNTSGAAKCWGSGPFLGDGFVDTSGSPSPVTVQGYGSGVAIIDAHLGNTCLVTTTGEVACWGFNDVAQLGDGSIPISRDPVPVSGLSSGVTDLDTGEDHSCAVDGSGAVLCWGDDLWGRLGDGSATDAVVPVVAVGLTSGGVSVGVGDRHSCAAMTDGTAWCWGYNSFGQLGDGGTSSSNVPVAVQAPAAGLVSVAAGGLHTCAVDGAGGAWCWGRNDWGQLGTGSAGGIQSSPVQVSGLTSGIASVVAATSHSCALSTAGGVSCWGSGGSLGDATWNSSYVPVSAQGLTSGVVQLAASGFHTCALLSTGEVRCWGVNEQGQLGDDSVSAKNAPTTVHDLPSDIVAIGVGEKHSCAAAASGDVYCWGSNQTLQLGVDRNGILPWHYELTPVVTTASDLDLLSGGQQHTCALDLSGGAHCWGENTLTQFGDGTIPESASPIVLPEPAGLPAVGGGVLLLRLLRRRRARA